MKLTLAQQDIFYEYLMYPEAPIHNIGAKILIEGNVDFAVLNTAYKALINQHDSYRSYLVFDKSDVKLHIHETFDLPLTCLDFSEEENAEAKAEKFMKEDFQIPFKLEKDTLLHKFIFIKVSESLGYLYSKYHHIITDGWGTSLMFERLVTNYNELIETNEIQSVYPFSYKDYIESDVVYQEGNDYKNDADYWKEKFSVLPENLLSKNNPNADIVKSKREELYLSREIYNKIIAFSKEHKISTFHFILGILYAYFAKRYQKEEIVIGVPVLNRKSAKFKKTVGLFMGVNALRIPVAPDQTFAELLASIRQQLRADYRHQQFPLGKLISELGISAEKRKLFDIMLSYEKQDYSNHFKNTKTTVIPMTHEAERVGLAIYIREFDVTEPVKIDFDYNINYFDTTSIQLVVTHFNNLVKAVLADAALPLHCYEYLLEEEKNTLLYTYNDTNFAFDEEVTVISKVEKIAKENSTKIAVRDHLKSYTYAEFFHKTRKIANFLQENLPQNTAPIAVLMNRSSDLVAVLFSIMQSGRAFIPLDPNFPKERLNYIIDHSNVQTLIGDKELIHALNCDKVIISTDQLHKLPDNDSELPAISAAATAYIIYTSGSTGKPKGVEVGHTALINFLLSMKERPGIYTKDTLYAVTTQSFDISILEFFLPLTAGATVYVADKNTLEDPKKIIQELDCLQPTIIQATPSFFQMLYNAEWNGNKNLKVLCGGDLLNEVLTQKLLVTNKSLWNMYGPTETTIWSSLKQITHASEASQIGKPIQNTYFYILDGHKKLLPTNTAGSLYIGGKGLAKGYYFNEILTKEKFTDNPFIDGEKIYETGDVGRWNAKGEIEFLGRNDQQVKIRGFRIELGDVETQINSHPEIKNSVVVAKKSEAQGAFLVAYVIAKSESIETADIIKFLQKKLPNYMVPFTIVKLDEFPLTFNKKVDRKQLTLRSIENKKAAKKQAIATDAMQQKLYEYYKKVLELQEDFHVSDSFFALGGHSLNAIRLIGYIEESFGYRLSLKELFDYPDIAALSTYLQNIDQSSIRKKEILPVATQSQYPVTFPQYAIWLASIQSERSIAYNMFGAYTIQGEINLDVMQQVFEEIIDRYEILRTNFLEIDGKPHQKIRNTTEIHFDIAKFHVTETAYEKALSEYLNREFDLGNDLLLKAAIFNIDGAENQLIFLTHHVILDGWSLELLIQEVTERYKAIVLNHKLSLPKLQYQFKDYAVWQNNVTHANEVKNNAFWSEYLHGYQWNTLIPYDKNNGNAYSGEFYFFDWEKNVLDALVSISLANNITLHTLLMASFHVLLNKMYGLTDICLGTINSGRTVSGLNYHLGMFVKTLPLRSRVDDEDTFISFAQRMHENLLSVDEHQDIPEDILNMLRFEAILVLQNQTFNYGKIEITDSLTLKTSPVNAQYNRLPMNIDFAMTDDRLRGVILYDTSKYHKETIDILVMKYEKLLHELIKNIAQSIRTIDIDLSFEKEEVIDIDFNF